MCRLGVASLSKCCIVFLNKRTEDTELLVCRTHVLSFTKSAVTVEGVDDSVTSVLQK